MPSATLGSAYATNTEIYQKMIRNNHTNDIPLMRYNALAIVSTEVKKFAENLARLERII